MLPVPFDPQVHRVHRIPCVNFLQKELHDPDLFALRHERTGNWVLASWVKPREILIELVVLGAAPVCTPQHVEKLRMMRTGSAEGARNRRLNRQELMLEARRHKEDLQETQDDMYRTLAWASKKVNHARRDLPMFRRARQALAR